MIARLEGAFAGSGDLNLVYLVVLLGPFGDKSAVSDREMIATTGHAKNTPRNPSGISAPPKKPWRSSSRWWKRFAATKRSTR